MKKLTKTTKTVKSVALGSDFIKPRFSAEANESTTSFRRNRASTISPTDKYTCILDGINPFYTSGSGALIDVQRTIELCAMAYYNVATVRNTIEIMVELCDSKMYLRGGNTTSKKFIGSWLKRIQLEALKEQFFREYHRSGNLFLFRFDAGFNENISQTLTESYGTDVVLAAKNQLEKLPIRYILLNSARIRTNNTVIFQNSQYFQMLTPIEMEKLRYPKTQQDEDMFNSLDPATKEKIKNNIIPYVPLDQERLYPIFAKKQDYEPFAIPFVFPVLEQINAHIEMQRIDQALARTVDRALLLITNGAKKDEGGISPATLNALTNLLKSESVTRTLVADYTTKGEWLIPDLSKVLGPEKYQELNRQINIGLNSVFFNDNEKFANTSVKTKIFIERLDAPRKKFLRFIQDEINRVCDVMGFKTYPEAYLEDIQLKDEAEQIRLFTRMSELGLLTPKQLFEAVDSGELPDMTGDDYINAHKQYKTQRDDGLFLPLVGASLQDGDGEAAAGGGAGRPQGTKAPQAVKKKVKPIGASFSMAALKENAIASSALSEEIISKTLKVNKLKELTENQSHICELIGRAIMLNEPKSKWKSSVSSYLKSVKSPSEEVLNEIDSLANEHEVSSSEATLLYLSKV